MVADIRMDGPVAWFTLDRPSVFNALNRDCMLKLSEFVERVERDETIRVAVISGAGRFFCAGADINEFLSSIIATEPAPGRKDFLDVVYDTFRALRGLSKPVIAAVNGPAVAGGLELVLSCDLVVAIETAEFGDAHANYGIIPGGGGSAFLPRLLPPTIAKYLLFTGKPLSAREMHDRGFVNLLVPSDELAARTAELAETIATKSPLVVAQMKRLANAAVARSLEDSVIDEFLTLRNHTRSADLYEGLTAFTEKRRPVFIGR